MNAFRWFKSQKPIVGKGVMRPADANNPSFAMTVLGNLKMLVMEESGQEGMYDSHPSDNEEVLGATECYPVGNDAGMGLTLKRNYKRAVVMSRDLIRYQASRYQAVISIRPILHEHMVYSRLDQLKKRGITVRTFATSLLVSKRC